MVRGLPQVEGALTAGAEGGEEVGIGKLHKKFEEVKSCRRRVFFALRLLLLFYQFGSDR